MRSSPSSAILSRHSADQRLCTSAAGFLYHTFIVWILKAITLEILATELWTAISFTTPVPTKVKYPRESAS
jgi:hypothetical protein